jgi:hypothetical protein
VKRFLQPRLFAVFAVLIIALISFPSFSLAYTDYSYRASLTIPATWFDADLTDFPILFTSANLPAGIFTYANADGGDIRFSSDEAGDNPLNREIVVFDKDTSSAEIWVKVPALDDTVDTVIYVWYGNAGASEPAVDDADEGSEGVWDAYFKAVYHLQEAANNDAGGYKDSTANDNHLTGTSMAMDPVAAKWGSGGLSADFDGSADDISGAVVPVSAYPATMSSWYNTDDGSAGQNIIGISSTITEYSQRLGKASTAAGSKIWADATESEGNAQAVSTSTYTASTWQHASHVAVSANSRFAELNGALGTENTTSISWLAPNTLSIASLRRSSGTVIRFNGRIDEVRISSAARSAAWLKAEYLAGNSPASITAGTPEDPTPPDVTDPTASVTAPTEGEMVSGATVTISGDASDDVGVAGVQFKLNTNTLIEAEDTSAPYSVTWDSTAVADGAHTLIAVARDAAGNYATSTAINITVDNTAPTTPGTPDTTSDLTNDNTPTWTWTASTDATAGLHATEAYSVDFSQDETFATGVTSSTTAANTYTHTDALATGTWYLRASAQDTEGNRSATSTAGSVIIDTVAPTAGTVAFPSITSTTITASTTGDSDANGLVASPYQYRNTTDDTYSGLQAETYEFTGLTPNTEYTFTVGVQDLAGNYATSSSAATTTRAALPSSLTLTTASQTQIDADWEANSNPALTEYYAENVEATTNSGWITDTEWQSTGLTCGTTYTIRVKSRNADNVETNFTGTSQTTSDCDVEEEEESSGSVSGGYAPSVISRLFTPQPIPPNQVPYINPIPVVSTPRPVPFPQLPAEVQTASEQEALSPLAAKLSVWLDRFPSLRSTFIETGVELNNLSSLGQLRGKKFILPNFVNSAVLPANVVLTKGMGKIDLNLTLEIDNNDEFRPVITALTNQTLFLSLRPDNPTEVVSITGYLVLRRVSLNAPQSTESFSFLPKARAQEMGAEIDNLPVLAEFTFTDPDGDGVYTAEIETPPVPGEYEILTLIKEKGREPKVVRLIAVIDPEGYVYRLDRDGLETRLPEIKVSLFRLDPYGEFELWSAKEYNQDNPQITKKNGNYSFLVPPGTYYLEATNDQYHLYRSPEFMVNKGQGVHRNIELKPIKSWLDWVSSPLIWLMMVIALILTVIFKNKFSNKS